MRPRGRERLRWLVKAALASAITSVHDHRLLARLERAPAQPLVLGYHRVVENFTEAARTEMASMLISRGMFERHLDCIGRHFRFVGLDEIAAHLASGEPFTDPVAAITFDDGYRDVYEQAYPVLKRKGIPAALFVVTDLVGRASWQAHDKLYHVMAKAFASWDDPRRGLMCALADAGIQTPEALLTRAATRNPMVVTTTLMPELCQADVGRLIDGIEAGVGNGAGAFPRTVAWDEIAEMRRAGFTIGSHTQTHASLPLESVDVVASELAGSKLELERRLGEPIEHFAYPGGHFTRPVVEALDRAGYRFGYTACPHGDPRYPLLTIERLLLWEGSSVDADGRLAQDVLSCQAHGLWPPARRCDRRHQA